MSAGTQIHLEVDFSKLVFLVVDDKPFYRDMAHTALMRAKAKDVKHAASIETALQLLNRLGQGIDCVILDWDIAPEGGLELLRQIRTRSLRKTPARTPVVILTGKPDSAAVIAAKKLDVNGFAVAPLSLEKLVKTIANGMARTWTLQEPAVYAAVPGVAATLSAPERPKGAEGPARAVARPGQVSDVATTALPRASHGAPVRAAAKPGGEAELINVRMTQLDKVKAGAILARDLHDKSGQLLLKSGTVLKDSLLNRLHDVAGGHGEAYHVWIGELAQAPH